MKNIEIPYFENLTLKDFKKIVYENDQVSIFFPDREDYYLLPRDYVGNMLHSILGDEFRNWVILKINERNLEYNVKHGKMLSVIPEIAKVVAETTDIPGRWM